MLFQQHHQICPFKLGVRCVRLDAPSKVARYSLHHHSTSCTLHSCTAQPHENLTGRLPLSFNTHRLYARQGTCHGIAARGLRWRALEPEARYFFSDTLCFRATFRTCARQSARICTLNSRLAHRNDLLFFPFPIVSMTSFVYDLWYSGPSCG